VQIFGFALDSELARALSAVLAGVIAVGGFLVGRWSQHRSRARFNLVASTIVIELYGITTEPDGRDVLHIISQGRAAALDRWFTNPDLVRHIVRAATRHPGLLRLPNAIAHRMMMDEGKDMITGLDPAANMDFVHGRPTRDDETLLAFAAYKENRDDRGLRDHIARLVLMVVSPAATEKLANPDYVARLGVAHAAYRSRCARLHDLACEWQRLQGLAAAERNPATDRIWQITVRTSLGSATEGRPDQQSVGTPSAISDSPSTQEAVLTGSTATPAVSIRVAQSSLTEPP
jgi:hypothetical protein